MFNSGPENRLDDGDASQKRKQVKFLFLDKDLMKICVMTVEQSHYLLAKEALFLC
jgi:hypothetical protein